MEAVDESLFGAQMDYHWGDVVQIPVDIDWLFDGPPKQIGKVIDVNNDEWWLYKESSFNVNDCFWQADLHDTMKFGNATEIEEQEVLETQLGIFLDHIYGTAPGFNAAYPDGGIFVYPAGQVNWGWWSLTGVQSSRDLAKVIDPAYTSWTANQSSGSTLAKWGVYSPMVLPTPPDEDMDGRYDFLKIDYSASGTVPDSLQYDNIGNPNEIDTVFSDLTAEYEYYLEPQVWPDPATWDIGPLSEWSGGPGGSNGPIFVPEPASMSLLAACLLLARRRRGAA